MHAIGFRLDQVIQNLKTQLRLALFQKVPSAVQHLLRAVYEIHNLPFYLLLRTRQQVRRIVIEVAVIPAVGVEDEELRPGVDEWQMCVAEYAG